MTPERKKTELSFTFPSYKEIPGVGLFLDQSAKYITEIIVPLGTPPITPSMISNYVKKKLIPSPVKKQYYREHLVMIMFIALSKTVLSLENIQQFLNFVTAEGDLQKSYEDFTTALSKKLSQISTDKKNAEQPVSEGSPSDDSSHSEAAASSIKEALINAIAAKLYLDSRFCQLT